jgi:AcrR family transcriptional regulator
MTPEASNPRKAGEASEGPPDLHLWKLPRGRHGLPRELVAQSQRERLMAAVVRVSAKQGYQATSVADILEVAGVGRESFYKHFKDKEDCFVAANDALIEVLEARISEAYEGPGTWPERVRRGLAATLEWFAVNPDVARVMMIEMGTVGPIASDRFRKTFRRFIALLDDGVEFIENAPADVANVSSIAGGAVFARIYEEVALGNADELLQKHLPQLTFELLLPYIGEDAARKEQRKAMKSLSAS